MRMIRLSGRPDTLRQISAASSPRCRNSNSERSQRRPRARLLRWALFANLAVVFAAPLTCDDFFLYLASGRIQAMEHLVAAEAQIAGLEGILHRGAGEGHAGARHHV